MKNFLRCLHLKLKFLLILKIEASSIPNEYNIFRKNVLIASVTVLPEKKYQINPFRKISYDEIEYLRIKFKKIANLSDKQTRIHTTE